MLIDEIIANGLDLAGGTLIKEKLDVNLPTLVCLNVIDTMMLELANSGKQLRGVKQEIAFAAGTNTGTFVSSGFALDEKYIRYREQSGGRWRILPIVNDIEELTIAENANRRAVCFQSAVSPVTYFLSFKPEQSLTAELWGKAITAEITDLSDLPPFPPEFSMLCAYRLADFVLNQLLLIDARVYAPFVAAQKQSIYREQMRCEHVWQTYRTSPPDAGSRKRVREYDFTDDLDADDLDANFLF